jgi:RNA polymerase sigma-70 factor (ECF subfamily)
VNAASELFEDERAALVRHAYRMLGDRAEAEDAVQDAYLRWSAARESATVADDRAYLRTTVTRLCIDRLRSARARREVYVGPWLPEPIVQAGAPDPEAIVALADDVSFALLLALERLSALERAAFLLHDVMEVPFAEVAATLGRSEDAVKALASRARTHVRGPRARAALPAREALRLRDRFAAAIASGDLAGLTALLTDDVVLVSDSGGKVPAAMVPVAGPDRVGRLLLGLARKAPAGIRVRAALVNGLPGFVLSDGGMPIQTLALESAGERIGRIYVTRNPDKLRGVPAEPA